MSIQHALLTSLLEKPSSGYELARRFDRSIGYFWRATHQQIYRELGRMTEAGWIQAVDDTSNDKRRRKTYHVLAAGKRELRRWVAEPGSPDQTQALMVKLRAAAAIGSTGLLREFERQIGEHQTRLETYRAIEQRDFCAPDMSASQNLQHAVLRYGIMGQENWLAWAKDVLPLLRQMERGADDDGAQR